MKRIDKKAYEEMIEQLKKDYPKFKRATDEELKRQRERVRALEKADSPQTKK